MWQRFDGILRGGWKREFMHLQSFQWTVAFIDSVRAFFCWCIVLSMMKMYFKTLMKWCQFMCDYQLVFFIYLFFFYIQRSKERTCLFFSLLITLWHSLHLNRCMSSEVILLLLIMSAFFTKTNTLFLGKHNKTRKQ